MKPLLPVIPFVGGIQVFFLNKPTIDFNLVGVADVLDIPGVRYVHDTTEIIHYEILNYNTFPC